jgi:GxxExxY protein
MKRISRRGAEQAEKREKRQKQHGKDRAMARQEDDERFEQFNGLTEAIIGAALRVHQETGPGIFESVYHKCMHVELDCRRLAYEAERPVRINYRGRPIDEDAFKIDILVEDTIILELKSVKRVLPKHKKQVHTYLRLTNKPLGLLVNFNVALLKNGIFRIINPRWDPDKD